MNLTVNLTQEDIEVAISAHVRTKLNTHSITHVSFAVNSGDLDGCPPTHPSITAQVTLEEMETDR